MPNNIHCVTLHFCDCQCVLHFFSNLQRVSPSLSNNNTLSSCRQTIPARCPGWWWPSRLWTWTTTHQSWTDRTRRPCATHPLLARSGQTESFSPLQMIAHIVFHTFVCVDGGNNPGERWWKMMVFLQHNQRQKEEIWHIAVVYRSAFAPMLLWLPRGGTTC